MKHYFVFFFVFFLIGCNIEQSNNQLKSPEKGTANLIVDNSTQEKINLGKKLFFDPRLSQNNNISCSSCHIPEFAFSDTVQFSEGSNGHLGFRNSPSILNVVEKSLFHKDGGVRTIELQILSPIIDSTEMAGDFKVILRRLNQDPLYIQLFQIAFDTLPSVFGITRAIANYERSLISESSAYDQYLNGDTLAITPSQKRGLRLFNSNQLKCNYCHNGKNLTNYTYQNIGLDIQNQDSGRARITMSPKDAGKFEVPSLRNVSITGPYMHNGSIATLSEVINYLAMGGGSHPNKSVLITPFTLTHDEELDLIHFLESLTDNQFSKN